ncbi:hypothetical protein [Actinoplanes sp. NPDC089786]|uniref:hypothetical protein n=1 Tax=Actinoplanes sp. NPDC089786 TaxID=3155185 RepID=UPI00341761E4
MSAVRRRATRGLLITIGICVLLVALIAWVVVLARGAPERADQWDKLGGAAGLVIAPFTIISVVFGFFFGWRSLSPGTTDRDSAVAADDLARQVRKQWVEETRKLGLRSHSLMLVPRSVEYPSRDAVGTPRSPAGRPVEHPGDAVPTRLASLLNAADLSRLLVLGSAGSGKTILAVQLLLELLDARQAGTGVPVLLNISSWDPTAVHLHAWMRRELTALYPAFPGGAKTVQNLIDDGLIVPFLDGLDEMPAQTRPNALTELSAVMGTSSPVVLVSRSREFEKAVRTSGATIENVVTIRMKPVRAPDIAAYLLAGTFDNGKLWEPVTARLGGDQRSVIAKALSTPLMAYLARVVYQRPPRMPEELLRFRTASQIEQHLLKEYAPSLYKHHVGMPDAELLPGSRWRRYEAEKATAWLAYLAAVVEHQQSPDIAWWKIPILALGSDHPVPGAKRKYANLCGLLAGLPAGGTLAATWVGPPYGIIKALSIFPLGTLFYGAIAAFVGRKQFDVSNDPQYVRTKWSSLLKAVVTGAAVVGAATALGVQLGNPHVTGAGIFAGSIVVLAQLCTTAGGSEDFVTPLKTLRRDRMIALTLAAITTTTAGYFLLLVGRQDEGYASVVFVALFSVVCAGFVTAWPRFLTLQILLAIRGEGPVLLLRFLEDARARGILRHNGASYQFRHASLQKLLAVSRKPR